MMLPPNPMDSALDGLPQPSFAEAIQPKPIKAPTTITRKLWFPFFTAFRNPGKFEQLQRESAALDMLELFDGVNFTLGRLASQTFSLSHNLQLPTESQHNYLLAADHQYNQNVALGAQWFSNGRVGGSVRYAGDPVRTSYQVSFDGASPNHSLDVDYFGPDCTASLKVTTTMGWILHAAYSQAITKDLALGVQLEGFFKPAEFGISWNGRYETPEWVFSGLFRYGSHGLFSVSRKIARGVTATSQVVVQQDPNTNSLVSSGLFGVEYQFQASRFKGTIDSRGVVRSVFEESIAEVMTITLCNELIFPAKKFRLGFGFSITL